jgi:hypothetical protein
MLLSNDGGSQSCRESIGEQIARSRKDSGRAKMCEEENILV